MGIIVDVREPANFRAALKKAGLKFKEDRMDTGDIVVWNDKNPKRRCVIERKRIDDLMTNQFSDRMFEQFARMGEEDFGVLIITGSIKDLNLPGTWARVSKFGVEDIIAKCVIKYDLRSIIWIMDGVEDSKVKGFATLVKTIEHMIGGQLDVIPPKRRKNSGDLRINALRSMFGLDVGVCERLLKRYKTVRAVMDLTKQQLMAIDGIGPVKAKMIVDILNMQYGSQKTIAPKKKSPTTIRPVGHCQKCDSLLKVVSGPNGDIQVCGKCIGRL